MSRRTVVKPAGAVKTELSAVNVSLMNRVL
jgi:hypothetical protein